MQAQSVFEGLCQLKKTSSLHGLLQKYHRLVFSASSRIHLCEHGSNKTLWHRESMHFIKTPELSEKYLCAYLNKLLKSDETFLVVKERELLIHLSGLFGSPMINVLIIRHKGYFIFIENFEFDQLVKTQRRHFFTYLDFFWYRLDQILDEQSLYESQLIWKKIFLEWNDPIRVVHADGSVLVQNFQTTDKRTILKEDLKTTHLGNGEHFLEYSEKNTELDKLKSIRLIKQRWEKLGQFSKNLVHQICNPLMGIQLMLDLDEPPEKDEDFYLIHDSVLRCLEIITDFHSFVTASSTCTILNVDKLMSSVQRLVKFSKRPKDQLIWDEALFKTVQLNAPLGLVQQVLFNLISNAFESGISDVVVSVQLDEQKQNLSVVDNGPGLPAHIKSSLFQALNTGKKEGNGLGLYLSRRIMRSFGGDLTYNFDSQSRTEFKINFPEGFLK